MTSFLEHLSRDLLEFWDGVSKYLSHKHLSHNVYCKKYDPCKALQYQFEPVYIFRDKCDVIFGTFVA